MHSLPWGEKKVFDGTGFGKVLGEYSPRAVPEDEANNGHYFWAGGA